MAYPNDYKLNDLASMLTEYAKLKHEYGAEGINGLLERAKNQLEAAVEQMKTLPISSRLEKDEPDSYTAIRTQRTDGSRKLWDTLKMDSYMDKLEGAMIARFAGCTLGAPVEFWSIDAMEKWASYIGIAFPPTGYWPKIKTPNDLRYQVSPYEAYTSEKMDGVPVDDDITYTILGLLIAEDYGLDFTTEDVGKAWINTCPTRVRPRLWRCVIFETECLPHRQPMWKTHIANGLARISVPTRGLIWRQPGLKRQRNLPIMTLASATAATVCTARCSSRLLSRQRLLWTMRWTP